MDKVCPWTISLTAECPVHKVPLKECPVGTPKQESINAMFNRVFPELSVPRETEGA